MNKDIEKAKLLLEKNGYVVKKWTYNMEEDADECARKAVIGEDKDCNSCTCLMCLAQ